MPKNRCEETDRAIRSAAWNLFREKGCDSASYTDLANASGISRPLVQRYYPKKAQLVDACLTEVREAASFVSDEAFPEKVHPLVRLFLLGQVNIAAYFGDEGTRRFMTDVFASRELTRQIIVDGFRWTVEHTLPEGDRARNREEPDEVLMATGGLYELVYAYLLTDRLPEIPRATMPSVVTFARFCGVTLPEGEESFEAMLSRYTVSEDELLSLARRTLEITGKNLSFKPVSPGSSESV